MILEGTPLTYPSRSHIDGFTVAILVLSLGSITSGSPTSLALQHCQFRSDCIEASQGVVQVTRESRI